MKEREEAILQLSTPQIGCGLVRIGRVWGVKEMTVPKEEDAILFLKEAYEMGVRVFDTAPSYGSSEERLGIFLGQLGNRASECFVATKCGEEFDSKNGKISVDHSREALERSIERSMNRLPHITLLQLHKANPVLLQNEAVLNLLSQYKGSCFPLCGVSVTDPETAEIALSLDLFDCIQFPYSRKHPELNFIFELAHKSRKSVLVSRPFGSGEHFKTSKNQTSAARTVTLPPSQRNEAKEALSFVIESMRWGGVILVGTINATHLQENLNVFQEIYAEKKTGNGI